MQFNSLTIVARVRIKLQKDFTKLVFAQLDCHQNTSRQSFIHIKNNNVVRLSVVAQHRRLIALGSLSNDFFLA